MTKQKLVVIVPIVAVVAGFTLMLVLVLPNLSPKVSAAQVQLVGSYVTQHIAELSPEPAVLGGTFHTTQIQVGTSTGSVSYEDGHIALVADFAYTVTNGQVTITSFIVRH